MYQPKENTNELFICYTVYLMCSAEEIVFFDYNL